MRNETIGEMRASRGRAYAHIVELKKRIEELKMENRRLRHQLAWKPDVRVERQLEANYGK